MKIVRLFGYVSEKQKKGLDKEAKMRHISTSALLRSIVGEYLGTK